MMGACSRNEQKVPLFESLSAAQTGIQHSNQLIEDENLNILSFEYFYNGAGVGAGDFNNDGLCDLFFCGNMNSCTLYFNEGKLKFKDVTQKAGIDTRNRWATGVSVVDINADGWLDIYVCCAGPYPPERRTNLLYLNQGNGTFVERAAEYGLDDTGHTTQAAFFDCDRDGDLDVYLLTNIMDHDLGPNVIRPKRINGEAASTDRLYRNDGGKFVNVSREAGILKEGYGLGVSVCDFNKDGWPDVYVSNDYVSNDLLWINNGDGTFTDRAAECFRHTSYSAMGNDVADYNNDTWPDMVALDMLPPDHLRRKMMVGGINYDRFRSEIKSGYFPQYLRNTLQLHQGLDPQGNPFFSEIGQLAGIQATDWSWSALFEDVDNDGWQDLLVTNGYPRDITNLDFASFKKEELFAQGYRPNSAQNYLDALQKVPGAYLPNFAFRNRGNLTFADQSANWGFTQSAYSHGAAVADLDNDGDLDYVVNNTQSPAYVYLNHSERLKRHYLRLRLQDSTQNQLALGAEVTIYVGKKRQFRSLSTARGYLSSVENVLHFGLGKDSIVDSIAVLWPNQHRQVLRNIKADQVLTISPEAGKVFAAKKLPINTPFLQECSAQLGLNYLHQEQHFTDFKIQPLLPHEHCNLGPCLAKGDINNDGLEDFFIGGPFNKSGQLFVQTRAGAFQKRPLETRQKYEEDTGALFFDADGDQDLDLYVCSGGTEFPPNAPYYQDRLYWNDGRGNFTEAVPGVLPPMPSSTSAVAAADYDRDGDLDLFVGGRIVPTAYAETPSSYLLENRQGRFVDVTAQKQALLQKIGRVTAAKWEDYNADGWPDLILAGEWMPIVVFENRRGKLTKLASEKIQGAGIGWWNALEAVDLDGDGDLDFMAGNQGLNHGFAKKDPEACCLRINDFNADGRLDAVLTQSLQGRVVPYHFRDDLFSWFPVLKKQFPDYTAYASADWKAIFPAAAKSTTTLCVETLESGWLEQRQGQFIFHPFPLLAQTAPIQGMLITDLNHDKRLDILLSGNSYAADPFQGRQDAFNGLVLIQGKTAGIFYPQTYAKSGFYLPGDARNLVQIKVGAGKRVVLAPRNGETLQAYQLNH